MDDIDRHGHLYAAGRDYRAPPAWSGITSFDPAHHPRTNSGQFAAKTNPDTGQLELTSPADAAAIAQFGPQGVHVAALIDRVRKLTLHEDERLVDAWNDCPIGDARVAADQATRQAARKSDRHACLKAAVDGSWHFAPGQAQAAARDAAAALVVRDLIDPEHYDTYTDPWRKIVGRLHPDDLSRCFLTVSRTALGFRAECSCGGWSDRFPSMEAALMTWDRHAGTGPSSRSG